MGIRDEVRDWLDGARVDLEEARAALDGGRYNWALFAAHQAAEKALKAAFMALRRERPPRTHDLTRLARELGIELPRRIASGVSELSPYYTAARYPNAGLERPWESISKETAEKLVSIAEELVNHIARLLEEAERT